jgi:hypothetical protein
VPGSLTQPVECPLISLHRRTTRLHQHRRRLPPTRTHNRTTRKYAEPWSGDPFVVDQGRSAAPKSVWWYC